MNGAMGTINDFNYKDGSLCSIDCSFVTEKGVVNVPIQRDRSMIKVLPDCYVVRNQFPLSLAFAMTIHKSQSLSLKTVFTDVGNTIFGDGQTYVALSRCKSLQGLYLLNFDPTKVKASSQACEEYKRLTEKGMLYNHHSTNCTKDEGNKWQDKKWYTSAVDPRVISALAEDISEERSKSQSCEKGKKTAVENVLHQM